MSVRPSPAASVLLPAAEGGAKRRMRGVFLATMFACASAFAQAPSADWRTIRTAHFRVHYPAQYEAWATEMASHIESVRSAVVREVGFSPTQITDVLVANPTAESNGVTLPFLGYPRIV